MISCGVRMLVSGLISVFLCVKYNSRFTFISQWDGDVKIPLKRDNHYLLICHGWVGFLFRSWLVAMFLMSVIDSCYSSSSLSNSHNG